MYQVEKTTDGYQIRHIETGRVVMWGLTEKGAKAEMRSLAKR